MAAFPALPFVPALCSRCCCTCVCLLSVTIGGDPARAHVRTEARIPCCRTAHASLGGHWLHLAALHGPLSFFEQVASSACASKSWGGRAEGMWHVPHARRIGCSAIGGGSRRDARMTTLFTPLPLVIWPSATFCAFRPVFLQQPCPIPLAVPCKSPSSCTISSAQGPAARCG